MKNYKLILGIVFGALCLAQIGVVLFQIMSYEKILKEGESFYFKVLPLDPYDPFRGRYVTLRFENATKAPIAQGQSKENQSLGYAILEHQEKLDSVKEITFIKPQMGNFLEVNVKNNKLRNTQNNTSSMVYFSLPYDRFYMREDIAPKAEKVLRLRSGVEVRAKLKVLNGKGVIEELLVGEIPLSEYVLLEASKSPQ